EPIVYRSKQFARLLCLALRAPEAGDAHCGTEFPRFSLLLTCGSESAFEIFFRFRDIPLGRKQGNFARRAVDLGLPPPFLRCFHRSDRFADAPQSIIEFSEIRMKQSQIR